MSSRLEGFSDDLSVDGHRQKEPYIKIAHVLDELRTQDNMQVRDWSHNLHSQSIYYIR